MCVFVYADKVLYVSVFCLHLIFGVCEFTVDEFVCLLRPGIWCCQMSVRLQALVCVCVCVCVCVRVCEFG